MMVEFHRKEISMKKALISFTLLAFLIGFGAAVSYGQGVDLTGTWRGATEVPDQGTDEMTLVIKKENGEYSGTITDSFGMMTDTECEEMEFKDGTLTFHFTIFMGTESMTVWINLTVEGDKMTGYWEVADGSQGDVYFEKEK